MPKTKDGGFLLDDSGQNPYAADGLDSEENPSNGNKDQKDDKSKRGS